MMHVTLNELANFSQKEQKLMTEIFEVKTVEETPASQGPSNESLNFIKNYSKVLSVRKSNIMGSISMVLN